MPIVPNSAYVTLETVSNLIRAIINDMIYSQAGEILTDSSNVLFPLMNDSLEWFQNEVNNFGVDTFTKETFLLDVTAIETNDPGIQINISDTGYFDGTQNFSTPQVPTDLYNPIFMWERQSGSTEEWVPMGQVLDGLPSVVQSQRLAVWEWRQDALYMPGAVQSNDLRLRYKGTHATFVTIGDTLYFRGGVGPIAWKTVSTYLSSRNPQAATAAAAEAQMRVGQIATRTARQKQGVTTTRQSYGMGRRGMPFIPPRNS